MTCSQRGRKGVDTQEALVLLGDGQALYPPRWKEQRGNSDEGESGPFPPSAIKKPHRLQNN